MVFILKTARKVDKVFQNHLSSAKYQNDSTVFVERKCSSLRWFHAYFHCCKQCYEMDLCSQFVFWTYHDLVISFSITVTSQITSLTIVYSTIYSGANQRKHQSSASLAFVASVNSPHKWPVTRKWFHLMTSSCIILFSIKMNLLWPKLMATNHPWGLRHSSVDKFKINLCSRYLSLQSVWNLQYKITSASHRNPWVNAHITSFLAANSRWDDKLKSWIWRRHSFVQFDGKTPHYILTDLSCKHLLGKDIQYTS